MRPTIVVTMKPQNRIKTGRYDVGILHSSFFILHSPFFTLHFNLYSSLYKIYLPFFDHYFQVIQRKKDYVFSSKRGWAFPKIVGTLRLRLSHNMVRPYRQRGKAPVALWSEPCHDAVRYLIASGKIGEQKPLFQKRWLSSVYKPSQFLRISNKGKLIFK